MKKQRRNEKQNQQKAQEVAKGGVIKSEGDSKDNEIAELPLGTILQLEGFTENSDTKREDIKEKLIEDFNIEEDSVAFVYYSKGETSAKLRFQHKNDATKLLDVMHQKLGENKLMIKDTEITFKVLEGDEEAIFLEQCQVDIIERKLQSKKGHKRRGDISGGRGGKRQRTR